MCELDIILINVVKNYLRFPLLLSIQLVSSVHKSIFSKTEILRLQKYGYPLALKNGTRPSS